MNELARRVLAETSRGPDITPAAGMQRACDQLCAVLGGVLGADYSTALFERAVHAAGVHPHVRAVAVGQGAACSLAGLDELAEEPGAEEVHVAILGETMSLLVRLIGAKLSMRFFRKAWPDVPFDPISEEGDE